MILHTQFPNKESNQRNKNMSINQKKEVLPKKHQNTHNMLQKRKKNLHPRNFILLTNLLLNINLKNIKEDLVLEAYLKPQIITPSSHILIRNSQRFIILNYKNKIQILNLNLKAVAQNLKEAFRKRISKKQWEKFKITKKDPLVNLPWPNRINQKIDNIQLEFLAEN